MRDVAVIGVGMTKFGRYPEKQVHEIAAEAVVDALQHDGLKMKDIQTVCSGGLLSKGHPISATGVANICEIVWQMRGEAQTQERQIPNARVGMAHNIALGTACAIHILTV